MNFGPTNNTALHHKDDAPTLPSSLRDHRLPRRPATCEACSRQAESSRRGRFLLPRQLTQRSPHGILAQRRISIDDLCDAHSTRQALKQKGQRDTRPPHTWFTSEVIPV